MKPRTIYVTCYYQRLRHRRRNYDGFECLKVAISASMSCVHRESFASSALKIPLKIIENDLHCIVSCMYKMPKKGTLALRELRDTKNNQPYIHVHVSPVSTISQSYHQIGPSRAFNCDIK